MNNNLTKKCCTCHTIFDILLFYKDNSRKDGYATSCKECSKKCHAKYYQKYKAHLNEESRIRRIEHRRSNMLYVLTFLKTHSCVDCGETDPVCLDFDHVRGIKYLSVSDMISQTYSVENIQLEIDKCEVRCSNCHRKKTAKERSYYDYIDFSTMTLKNQ